ncbi:hypothetical protein MANES_07G030402v8 [Manihot esculenta]|uniref:Uncharacterized protein n=1 Tax=Manihot esculenta TaxID=3983 RepID=A0ACB7HHN2_MANES|nr:hypothetical protein MANES_07G030402v8 [Manihot esculenta]
MSSPEDLTRVRFGPVDKAIRFFPNDLLVVKILLNRYEVRRVLVDTGSSVNLLILNVFNKLGLDKGSLVRVSYPLVGLEDKTVAVLGTINLPLVLGDEKYKRELYAEFTVVDILFVYNVILNRPALNCHGIVINMEKLESHIKPKPADPIEEVRVGKEQKVQLGTMLIREIKA